MWKKNALKTALFLVICAVMLIKISQFMTYSVNYLNHHMITEFYDEPNDSLDAVYIGASNVYTYWSGPLAWEKYGIAVYSLSNGAQPFAAAQYLIDEARKTQPNALYIVGINHAVAAINDLGVHYIVDNLPFSKNKIEIIQTILNQSELYNDNGLELYFPLVRYHSRWNELSEKDFNDTGGGIKGTVQSTRYDGAVKDISTSFQLTSKRTPLSDHVQETLEKLIAYCDEENVNVLFVVVPQAKIDERELAQINTISDYVEMNGYPVFNMMDRIDEIGLDLSTDFYNENHTNVHGRIKTTDYFAQFLVNNYGFTDKRGNAEYASWDQAYEKYIDIMSAYAQDFELAGAERDYFLAAPELSKLSVNGTTLTLNWKKVNGADGYCVYRKTKGTGWSPIATVDGDTLTYQDTDCTIAEQYTYTVAAFRKENDIAYWGSYDFNGLSATAIINNPRSLKLFETEDGVTLTWEEKEGAEFYRVMRRVVGKDWIDIANVYEGTTYTDTTALDGLPYQYLVRSFWHDEKGNVMGGQNATICLRFPEFSEPEVELTIDGGVPVLTWPVIEGITGYSVSRKGEDGKWEQIAEALPADCTRFRDITAHAGEQYAYRVTAYFIYENDRYEYQTETSKIRALNTVMQLNAPEIVFGEQLGNNIQLLWEPQNNVTAYRVYRQMEGSDSWTVVRASITGNTYQERPPEAGTYYYVIQSLYTESGCTYYGDFQENAAITIVYTK